MALRIHKLVRELHKIVGLSSLDVLQDRCVYFDHVHWNSLLCPGNLLRVTAGVVAYKGPRYLLATECVRSWSTNDEVRDHLLHIPADLILLYFLTKIRDAGTE